MSAAPSLAFPMVLSLPLVLLQAKAVQCSFGAWLVCPLALALPLVLLGLRLVPLVPLVQSPLSFLALLVLLK